MNELLPISMLRARSHKQEKFFKINALEKIFYFRS